MMHRYISPFKIFAEPLLVYRTETKAIHRHSFSTFTLARCYEIEFMYLYCPLCIAVK